MRQHESAAPARGRRPPFSICGKNMVFIRDKFSLKSTIFLNAGKTLNNYARASASSIHMAGPSSGPDIGSAAPHGPLLGANGPFARRQERPEALVFSG